MSNIINPSEFLTPQERKMLLEKKDWKAWLQVVDTWGWIAAMMTLVALFPNVLTVIVALFIIGGKQLGCSILMHDAGHYALFNDKKLNDFVGKWLGSYPIMNDVIRYREYHLRHHLSVGTAEDPDISLTKGYPAGVKSMLRKFARDLSGATGIKSQIALVMTYLGYLKYNLSRKVERISQKDRTWAEFFRTAIRNLHGPILSNLMIFGILWLIGQPQLYWLWIGALLTTFNFSIRVRSIAEHSMTDDVHNPLRNTRTTYANWFERLLFAPNNVNYHLEHHLMMGVPSYNLPKMHNMLKEKGFYENALLEKGYWNIIKQAMNLKTVSHS